MYGKKKYKGNIVVEATSGRGLFYGMFSGKKKKRKSLFA